MPALIQSVWLWVSIGLIVVSAAVLIAYFAVTETLSKDDGDDGDDGDHTGSNSSNTETRETASEAKTNILDTSRDDAVLRGFRTDAYSWHQSQTEVEVFVFLKDGDGGGGTAVRAKEIDVVIEKFHLKVIDKRVKDNDNSSGRVLLHGMLYAEVVPEECSWQIEGSEASERCVWISLFKRFPTARNQHWRSLLAGDKRTVNTKKLGPPVHKVDANDNQALADAIAKVKQYKKTQ